MFNCDDSKQRKVLVLAEIIKIPPGMHLNFRRHDDAGSNLVEAYVYDSGPLGGYLGQRFKGYEHQGRTPFSTAEIQDFIYFIALHRKYRNLALVVIDFFGTADFTELRFVPDKSVKTHALADQPIGVNQPPYESKPKGNRAKRQARRKRRIAERQTHGETQNPASHELGD